MIWVYVYLGILIASLVVEFVTSDMLTIWFSGGSVVGLILAAFRLSWYIHLPIFLVVSLVLLFSFRPLVMKMFSRKEEKTNAQTVIGKEFELITGISFNKYGTIKVNDVVWNVVCEDEKAVVKEGTVVRIKDIKGNKYIVEEV